MCRYLEVCREFVQLVGPGYLNWYSRPCADNGSVLQTGTIYIPRYLKLTACLEDVIRHHWVVGGVELEGTAKLIPTKNTVA